LHILGAGGTVGVLASMHYKFKDIGPTTLKFTGLAKDHFGKIINTKEIKKKQVINFTGAAAAATKIILSLGSSMDSGKTTSAAYLVHGLKKAGHKVAYIKLTGTVYTKDADLANDLGADTVADFSDFGFPSTYMCDLTELLDLYESLVSSVLLEHPDYVIMEIADGLYQRETKMLLTCKSFRQTIEAVMFSAGDSLAAINGIKILNNWNLYPAVISGLFTASPLLIREVKENTTVPVYDIDQLATAEVALSLFTNNKRLHAIH
jgi:predicted nucleic acid-binding protein